MCRTLYVAKTVSIGYITSTDVREIRVPSRGMRQTDVHTVRCVMSRYIDADAIKEKIDDIWDGRPLSFLGARILATIDEAPTINADRPKGKWIRDRYWSRGTGMGEEYGFFYKCSLCEYEVENGYTRCGFNFCPYCGADMRERESE